VQFLYFELKRLNLQNFRFRRWEIPNLLLLPHFGVVPLRRDEHEATADEFQTLIPHESDGFDLLPRGERNEFPSGNATLIEDEIGEFVEVVEEVLDLVSEGVDEGSVVLCVVAIGGICPARFDGSWSFLWHSDEDLYGVGKYLEEHL
jgi:hypothetical protein